MEVFNSVTDDYLTELYSDTGIYKNFTYGSPFVSRGLRIATHLTQFWRSENIKKKILCIGAGNGYEVVKYLIEGHDCYSVELYHPEIELLKDRQVTAFAQDLPFEDEEFDILICCEVLEHVPEELSKPILKEAKRVSREVLFTIADRPDPPYNTHINLHELPWWYELFKELRFEIVNAQFAPKLALVAGNKMISQTWGDGLLIHAKC